MFKLIGKTIIATVTVILTLIALGFAATFLFGTQTTTTKCDVFDNNSCVTTTSYNR